jgi:hypothetical protein
MRGRMDQVVVARHGVEGIRWLSLMVRVTLLAVAFKGNPRSRRSRRSRFR